MRFIVSPAKKMNVVDNAFDWRDLPAFVDDAYKLVVEVRALSYEQAKELWQCSEALADLNYNRFQVMEVLEGALTPALLTYEGIQYQSMAPHVMTEQQLAYVQEHLRILSGLYGVLRPLDGVTPYRLEMQAKLGVSSAKNLYEYWGSRLYNQLAVETDVIVNLASVEYAKAVLPHAKVQEDNVRVLTCLFKAPDKQGRLIQRSTAAKAARGAMVRWCSENNCTDPEDLKGFDALGYAFAADLSDRDTFVFALR